MKVHGSTNDRTARLSRRDTLRLMGGAGAAALLGARGVHLAAGQEGSELITIPDTGADLPTEEITFRWVDSGDQKAVFFRQFFEAYQEAHPNITIEYDPLPWNEIAQVVPLGVQNNNAHDVFQIPLGVTQAQAVREGWVAPLDDVVPNFEEWKAAFPPGAFVEGITMFDGRAYTLPIGSNKRYSTHLLYNVEYMEEAGYDPSAEPLTWDDFRDAARRITEQGSGEYYGLIIGGNQVNRWAEVVGNLAQMAGSPTPEYQGGRMNWQTGEFEVTSDEHLAAIELLLAIKDDGSMFPGSLGQNAPQARAMMPQGAAGMILQGPWNIPIWQEEAPDFNFGVASQPVPNEGEPMPLSLAPGGANHLWIFAGSPYQEVAGDMFAYLGSEDGQRAWASIVSVADPPMFPSALEAVELDERSQAATDLFEEQLRLRPEPLVRNPEVSQVLLEWQSVTPNLGETIQGIYTGQLADPQQALQEVEDRYNAELDRAIAAAQEKGAEVSREDWVFANWDPTRDYTDEDYAEL